MLRLVSALVGIAFVGASAAARADVPDCQDLGVLGEIQSQFSANSADVLKSDLALSAIVAPYQTYPTIRRPSPLARRYCAATAHLNNGRRTAVYYLIEEKLGFAGMGWNVDSCVAGHDRWYVHDGRCRTVRKWW